MEKIIVLYDVDKIILHMLDSEALYILSNSNKHVKTVVLKDPQLRAKYTKYRMRYTGLINDMRKMMDEDKLVEVHVNNEQGGVVSDAIKLTEQEAKMIMPYKTKIIIVGKEIIYKVYIDEVINSIKALLLYLNQEFDINNLTHKQGYMIYNR